MPHVAKNRTSGMTVTYDRGAYRSLRDTVRVVYTQAEMDALTIRGPQILVDAIDRVISEGYSPFSSIDTDGTPMPNPDPTDTLKPLGSLVLVNATPSVVISNNCVDVALTYEHLMDGHNQILRSPPSGILYTKLSASTSEKPTNFYYPNNNRALPRQLIKVAHTFQTLETGIPNMPYDPDLPRTVVKSGEINVPFPGENFTLQGMWYTNDIVADKNLFLGKMNLDVILGQPAKTYLCSQFSYEMHNSRFKAFQQGKKGAFKVTMEFQYNYDTWEATVAFHDQRTGNPPADVKEGLLTDLFGNRSEVLNPISGVRQPAGWWKVPVLGALDFSAALGNVIFDKVGV